MVRSTVAATSLAIVALASSSSAFAPIALKPSTKTRALHMSSIPSDYLDSNTAASTAVDVDVTPSMPASAAATKPKMAKKKKAAPAHKAGVFSPIVSAAKMLLGEEELNKVRAKVISMHSDVIKNFVATAETPIGQSVLKSLFELSDKNADGKLDRDEVAAAVRSLGFDWLKDKQIDGIVKRADIDEDGYICVDEFCMEAPKTLKTNLVKLAKKNGGEMGWLV